ncbi:MAG: response regulator [Elusimicrobia bacterium]|nr:response regulator [Elusimicrobiota bacterium]
MENKELGKETLLIVDDDPVFRALVGAAVGGEFRVLEAADGKEGLETARREAPHLILLDLMMPQVSGVEMLRELQSDMATRSIPVILISASHLARSTKNLLEEDVNVAAFLEKPCAVERIRQQIRAALDRKIAAELDSILSDP